MDDKGFRLGTEVEVEGRLDQTMITGATPISLGNPDSMRWKNRDQRPNHRAQIVLQDEILKVHTRLEDRRGVGSTPRLRTGRSGAGVPWSAALEAATGFVADSREPPGAAVPLQTRHAGWNFHRTPRGHRVCLVTQDGDGLAILVLPRAVCTRYASRVSRLRVPVRRCCRRSRREQGKVASRSEQ